MLESRHRRAPLPCWHAVEPQSASATASRGRLIRRTEVQEQAPPDVQDHTANLPHAAQYQPPFDRCEWCGDTISVQSGDNPKQDRFMNYHKDIFCSRQWQKRAQGNGLEGSKHTIWNGEFVELHFIA